MSIGPAHLSHAISAPLAPLLRTAGVPSRAEAIAQPADDVDGGIPATVPPDVLDQVSAAAECVLELARNGRELHFRADEELHRVIIEVRDMAGNVLRTIPPSTALELVAASAARETTWLA